MEFSEKRGYLITVSFNKKNLEVHPIGFEPITAGAEIQCSIQLSHGCNSISNYISVIIFVEAGRIELPSEYIVQSASTCLGCIQGLI